MGNLAALRHGRRRQTQRTLLTCYKHSGLRMGGMDHLGSRLVLVVVVHPLFRLSQQPTRHSSGSSTTIDKTPPPLQTHIHATLLQHIMDNQSPSLSRSWTPIG